MAAPKEKRSFRYLPYLLIVALLIVAVGLWHHHITDKHWSKKVPTVSRDFMFQVDNFYTKNQGGQTLTMYFHYRYNDGIQTADIPDYRDLRTEAIHYMNTIDTSQNPYWETLTKNVCEDLKNKFPIEAISCQFQVAGDDRAGLPNEPGIHSSITTIGDITPLTFAK